MEGIKRGNQEYTGRPCRGDPRHQRQTGRTEHQVFRKKDRHPSGDRCHRRKGHRIVNAFPCPLRNIRHDDPVVHRKTHHDNSGHHYGKVHLAPEEKHGFPPWPPPRPEREPAPPWFSANSGKRQARSETRRNIRRNRSRKIPAVTSADICSAVRVFDSITAWVME